RKSLQHHLLADPAAILAHSHVTTRAHHPELPLQQRRFLHQRICQMQAARSRAGKIFTYNLCKDTLPASSTAVPDRWAIDGYRGKGSSSATTERRTIMTSKTILRSNEISCPLACPRS